MIRPLYRCDPPHLMKMVELEGLTALYHVSSGMTHILAPPAPQILAALQEGPADRLLLLSRLSRRYEIEALDVIDERLSELETAGLVSRI